MNQILTEMLNNMCVKIINKLVCKTQPQIFWLYRADIIVSYCILAGFNRGATTLSFQPLGPPRGPLVGNYRGREAGRYSSSVIRGRKGKRPEK